MARFNSTLCKFLYIQKCPWLHKNWSEFMAVWEEGGPKYFVKEMQVNTLW